MHILEIDRGDDELVQGFVRASWPQRADLVGGRATAWIKMFLRSASLWSQVKPLSAAVRIAIAPGRPVTTVHSFVTAKANEQRLRLVLAAFMRTDQMGAGETEAPQRGEDLAGRFIHPGERRLALVHETLRAGKGLAIHQNLRLADRLPRLLQTFADLGIPFAYEIQATPWAPPRDRLKELLHNVARLTDTPGVPARLSQDQAALGERVKHATFHMEECLSANAQHLNAVGETLASLLGETFYADIGAAPTVEPLDQARAEAFAHHVHSRVMLDAPAETLADLTDGAARDEVDRCLSCLPLGLGPAGTAPPELEPLALSLGPIDGGSPGSGGGFLHKPGAGDGAPFLFVSYARNDGGRVYPLVDELVRHGASIWIDRHIVGGDDWVVELENQLLRCTGILAFVSPAFVGSKYCGREVRFGDALDKKIIPVFLEPADLSGGMNFILHALQRVMLAGTDDLAAIASAIRAHAPAAWTATRQ
jgi:TIR domain